MQNPISIEGVTNSEFLRTALNARNEEAIRLFDFIKIVESNVKDLDIKNDIIHIDMDNCIYTISSVMMYKRFIDKISYKYKTILKYLPSITNNKISNELLIKYYKCKQVTLFIKEKGIIIE